MKLKKEKGITLIALVVTIIVLIILAGVSINLLLGQYGIITRAKNAKDSYAEESIKERISIMIADYEVEKNITNKSMLVYLEEQVVAGNIENVTDNEDGTYTIELDGYEITLNSSNGQIIDIGKLGGIKPKITLTKNTEEMQEEVIIHVNVTTSEGTILSVTKPDGSTTTDLEFDYPVTENKRYIFKAEGSNGRSAIAIVEVNTIIEIPKITIQNITEENYTIVVTSIYKDDLITEYKYYVNNEIKSSGTTNTSCILERSNETVTIFVEAYIGEKILKSDTIELIGKYTSSLNSTGDNSWGNFAYETKSNEQYIQYFYGTPYKATKIQFTQNCGSTQNQLGAPYVEIILNVQGSNDGINFNKLTEDFTIQCSPTETINSYEINSENKYLYYRLNFVSGGWDGQYLSYNNKINFNISNLTFLHEN